MGNWARICVGVPTKVFGEGSLAVATFTAAEEVAIQFMKNKSDMFTTRAQLKETKKQTKQKTNVLTEYPYLEPQWTLLQRVWKTLRR